MLFSNVASIKKNLIWQMADNLIVSHRLDKRCDRRKFGNFILSKIACIYQGKKKVRRFTYQ
jgi:hypothetical protein